MGFGPAAGVRLVGALSLFDLAICSSTRYDALSPLPGPDETSIVRRTPKFQNGFAGIGDYPCATFAGLDSTGSVLQSWPSQQAFGFSPKISTTVENTVEKPG